MGMGSAPVNAFCINSDDLRTLVPNEYDSLLKVLEEHELDLNYFAQTIDDESEFGDEIILAYQNLRAAFERVTASTDPTADQSRLSLSIFHYDAEKGERYDDLEHGANWCVEGMVQLTPAGERYKHLVQEKAWTVFG
jgi:hypothetical protein